jgi:catechol 2,3-dioxygenase-like lactoylglutathione lyase family enzyme
MATKIEIEGYSHIAICVRDLDAARTFYGETLGLAELPRPDFGFPGAWYRVGALQLHLMSRADADPGDGLLRPHIALHVPTDRFHPTLDALRAAGVPVALDAMQRADDGCWQAFVTDPDGNLVELTDMGPLA